VNIYSPLVGHI